MRKSHDGLVALVNSQLGLEPLSGQAFVFINRPRTPSKCLYLESGGYHKCLELLRPIYDAQRAHACFRAKSWPWTKPRQRGRSKGKARHGETGEPLAFSRIRITRCRIRARRLGRPLSLLPRVGAVGL